MKIIYITVRRSFEHDMASPLNAIISEISAAQRTTIKVESEHIEGQSNIVYKLRTGAGERWCLRVPVDAGAGRLAARGASLLKEVRRRIPTLQAPAVIHASESYTLLEFLPGYALGSWNTHALPREQRQVLLNDLADFLFNLWKIENIGQTSTSKYILAVAERSAGPPKSYKKWLQDEVDRGLRRTLKGTSSWGDPIHYLRRRMKIDDLVPPQDTGSGSAVVRHGDLNAWNVIVQESGLAG